MPGPIFNKIAASHQFVERGFHLDTLFTADAQVAEQRLQAGPAVGLFLDVTK
jgi:hypothetical protein